MRTGILVLFMAMLPFKAAAEESSLGLSYVQTKDFRVIYFDPIEYLVPHVVGTSANALEWQRRTFGLMPSEPVTILLKDLADYGNAATVATPHNRMSIDIAPLSHAFETFPATERMATLMNHELVHIMQGDIASDEDRRWRRFFLGKVTPQAQHPESLLYSYLTVPRYTAPRWYLEGGAVFMETWMDGGLGRAQGGYDEMVFRGMVRDNAHFYDTLGLVSRGTKVDFQTGANAYLYGTRFFTWLAYIYSPEKVVSWLRRDEGSARYFSDQFQQVFGLPLETAWQNWIDFEHKFQQSNLDEVRKFPITPYKPLTASAIGSISRMYFDEPTGMLYAAFRYPGVVEHVGALNTRDGSVRRLADIKRAKYYRVASVAFDPASGTFFYTNDDLALRDLMAVDVKTGEARMLLEDARIGEIVFNPVDRSLLGIRHNNGIASLVRIPFPYTEWNEIHVFNYETVPYDLDISPDGKRLSASMSEVNADQFLRVWELDKILKGDVTPLSEFRFGQSIPESFVFSKDGRYLYGSSYYTGVSNIFRYEVATGDVVAVSNAEIGFFRPVPLADGRLAVLAYTGEGFVPATIDPKPLEDASAITFLGTQVAEKYPIVKTWQVPPPTTAEYDKEVIAKGPYAPLRNMALENAFPIVTGYKDALGIGYHFNIADPIAFANLGITLAYTPGQGVPGEEQGHVNIKGNYLGWRGELYWNRTNFYDIFGPTKRSQKGYAAKAGYDWLLIYDEPRKLEVKFDYAYYDQIDTLPGAQNVDTSFTRLTTGEIGIYYTDVRRSIGAVDGEKGVMWSAVANASRVSGEVTPQVRGTLDVGFDLPLPNSSFWFRGTAGMSDLKNNATVANFYFGGFGNNYVDDGAIQRYREWDAFPGFGLQEISGLNFAKGMIEWNIPPLVFESAGTPAFHATWLRPAIFASAMVTNMDNSALRQNYQNVGTQADLRFSILHWYDLTLSAGYAVGFREGKRAGSEWMLSLKIF